MMMIDDEKMYKARDIADKILQVDWDAPKDGIWNLNYCKDFIDKVSPVIYYELDEVDKDNREMLSLLKASRFQLVNPKIVEIQKIMTSCYMPRAEILINKDKYVSSENGIVRDIANIVIGLLNEYNVDYEIVKKIDKNISEAYGTEPCLGNKTLN